MVTRSIREVERYGRATIITAVALANYLEIEVETDALKQMHEKGPMSVMQEGLGYWFASFFLGNWASRAVTDHAGIYSARQGSAVTFREDMGAK
jgi:hypothetical protein